MESRRYKCRTKSVHFGQRCHISCVTKIISIFPRVKDGQAAGSTASARILEPPRSCSPMKGNDEARKIRTTSCTANHNVRIFPCHFHLLQWLLTQQQSDASVHDSVHYPEAYLTSSLVLQLPQPPRLQCQDCL